MDLVSIVVPCYKQSHFLSEALQSVLNQTYVEWECVIVNDGSPDNTAEVAEYWRNQDPRFKYLEKVNGGLCSARNAGIAISKGEYIVALDADDILHQDYLKKLLHELIKDNTLCIVSCYRSFFRKDKSITFYHEEGKGTTYRDFMFENIIMPSAMFRKKYWIEVGGYDESMKHGFEDWEFWLSITKNGRKFKFIEEYLFYYRKSENSMLIDTLKNHRIKILQYVFNKHKEIYIENYDNTVDYLFFLINLYRESEIKYKYSMEYRIGKIITKPFRILQNLFKQK
jgi:glycosyltransferase involved in cell wall biosynthesis